MKESLFSLFHSLSLPLLFFLCKKGSLYVLAAFERESTTQRAVIGEAIDAAPVWFLCGVLVCVRVCGRACACDCRCVDLLVASSAMDNAD